MGTSFSEWAGDVLGGFSLLSPPPSPAQGCQRIMTKPKIIQTISDLQPDPDNANLGTERGLRVLDDSLRECGAGRSILFFFVHV